MKRKKPFEGLDCNFLKYLVELFNVYGWYIFIFIDYILCICHLGLFIYYWRYSFIHYFDLLCWLEGNWKENPNIQRWILICYNLRCFVKCVPVYLYSLIWKNLNKSPTKPNSKSRILYHLGALNLEHRKNFFGSTKHRRN